MKKFPTLESWMMTYYIEPLAYYTGKGKVYEFVRAESDMDIRSNAVLSVAYDFLKEIEDVNVIESDENTFLFSLKTLDSQQ